MAHKNLWWQDGAVYQIYPRSFFDSNGDGNGDLRGIEQKIDYIKNLGVDAIWCCPCFKSPQVDNGYDVADYRDIDPIYGTLEDWKSLVKAAHERGLKFIMDLVVNHTSDQHEWFKNARSSRENPYHDYYIFRDAGDGKEPCNWRAVFGGSVWEYNEATDEYYLHLFSKEQPDLNWNNENVVREIHDVVRYWCRLGVDGFRLDTFNNIDKDLTFPHVEPLPGSKYGRGTRYCVNRPGVDLAIRRLRKDVLDEYGATTVAEVSCVEKEVAKRYSDPACGEFDAIYFFDGLNFDQEPENKFMPKPRDLAAFKKALNEQQQDLFGCGWQALFIDNHDQARGVSRFGDDKRYPAESAKALANAMYFLRGTPYIFQGDEIGMTNLLFDQIEDFRDVEVRNAYREHVVEQGEDEQKWLGLFRERSRDNGRSPMQWDSGMNAGFSEGTPWMPVNKNYAAINVERQEGTPGSVLEFYKKLLAVRKQYPVVFEGRTEFIDMEDPVIFAYKRVLEGEVLLSVGNFSGEKASFILPDGLDIGKGRIILSDTVTCLSGKMILEPYECFTAVFR
ncbi:MAG: alpha-glucosidase [Lachnospiraceae bacterium]|nr:alpha-glucosidase [Lachnospiraceae bacterium]